MIGFWIIQYCDVQWFNCFLVPNPGVVQFSNLSKFCAIRVIIDSQIFQVYEVVGHFAKSQSQFLQHRKKKYRMLAVDTTLIIFEVLIALAIVDLRFFCSICALARTLIKLLK